MNQELQELMGHEKFHELVKKRNSGFTTAFFYLMKDLNIPSEELLTMPVSRLNVLLLELKEHNEREKKASKKKR